MIVKLTVSADIIFVNGTPFVVSVSIQVNFTMVEYVGRRLNTILTNSVGNIFQFYKNNGYSIKTFLIDREVDSFVTHSLRNQILIPPPQMIICQIWNTRTV